MQRCPLTRIVLASGSPRRLELLRSLGLEVVVVRSGYPEPPVPGLRPVELAVAHAREKLTAVVAKAAPELAVVAADTVVDLDGASLGKPRDGADAVRMLQLLCGREHLVHTAFALSIPGRDAPLAEVSTTRVRFAALDGAELEQYVAGGDPMDKAGGYGIQGRGAALVESIDGDYYTVMGFPLGRFIRALRRLGFSLPVAKPTGP